MDEKFLELAAKLEQQQREDARQRVERALRPEKHPDFDGAHCVDCEDDIPQGRLALGKIRCVPCQSMLEK